MATFGSNSFGTGTTPEWRKQYLKQGQGEMDVDLGLDNQFDITKTPLYQASAQTAKGFMSGETPEFDVQADIAREAQKAASAQRTKQQRELLMQSGLRDTGTYVEEGLIKPEEQTLREREDFERRLAAQRGQLATEKQQAGLQAAQGLMGLTSQEQLGYAGIGSQERIAAGGWEHEKELQQAGFGHDVDMWGRSEGLEKWKQDRYEELTRQGWEHDEAMLTLGKEYDIKIQKMNQDYDKWKTEYGFSQETAMLMAQLSSSEKIAGMEIASREKIAADQVAIQQQGLDLEKAGLYGYTDANGNHVMGTAELAAAHFGLESDTVDMQRDELYGYTDPKTGQRVRGRIELMNDEDKRAAEELYGYTDANGNHVMGTLELQADRNAIERSGLELEEAKVFGYTDDNGQYHPGTLEMEYDRLGIDKSRLKNDTLALFGGVDENGNTVKGTLQLQAEELGLQSQTLELQQKELFGGMVKGPDGKEVWQDGKYQLMSDAEQRQADELYGYWDKVSGEYVPGKFRQAKDLMTLQSQLELELTKAGIDYQTVMSQLENMEGDEAFQVIADIAKEQGIDLPAIREAQQAANKESGARAIGQYDSQRASEKDYDLSVDQVDAIKNSGSNRLVDDPGNTFEQSGINQWVDGFGVKNHWSISDDARAWVNENKGKIYVASNGHAYEIVGYTDKDERHARASIQFKDLQTNQVVNFNDKTGFPTATVAGV